MKNLDPLRLVLIVNVVAAVTAAATSVVVAAFNAGSKNLPLAAAAVFGVLVGYLIQLPFELATSSTREVIGVELTTDRQELEIRQWSYPMTPPKMRTGDELQASRWLRHHNPSLFGDLAQRDQMAADFMSYSLFSFLARDQRDWQLERDVYGDLELAIPVSKPEDCTPFSAEQAQHLLILLGHKKTF